MWSPAVAFRVVDVPGNLRVAMMSSRRETAALSTDQPTPTGIVEPTRTRPGDDGTTQPWPSRQYIGCASPSSSAKRHEHRSQAALDTGYTPSVALRGRWNSTTWAEQINGRVRSAPCGTE